MSLSTYTRRQHRLTPYARDHRRSLERRMDVGVMPKDLNGLLRWFEEQWSLETPDALHARGVWRDRVSRGEAEQGITPVGGSDSGAPAYHEPFRRRLENSPSETDQDGYYVRPLASALSRIARNGKPLMTRTLLAVGMAGFDWRKVADHGHLPHEMFEVYVKEALIRLWRELREQKVIAA